VVLNSDNGIARGHQRRAFYGEVRAGLRFWGGLVSFPGRGGR